MSSFTVSKSSKFQIFVGIVLSFLTVTVGPLFAEPLMVNMEIMVSDEPLRFTADNNVLFTDNIINTEIPGNTQCELLTIPGSKRMLLFVKGQLQASSESFRLKGNTQFKIEGLEEKIGSRKGLFFYLQHNQIHCILRIPMDDYLCGVLTAEMGNLAPIEALKAQAVASRTYVMERMADKGLANQNHVPSDSRGQVFTMGEENSLCHQAVKATEGEILIFNKKPAKTLYSSCCGGVTADASHVFGGEKLAWLISQRDHGWLHKKSSNTSETLTLAAKAWCQQAPRFRWRREYTGEQISELLGLSQPVDSITVNQTTQSGRIEEIVVTEGKSTIKKMTGNQFRLKLQLPSTLFTVKHPAKSMLFTFIGGGFGHGVGLCQHGAMGQAREGKKYKEILTFYYPGTEIIRTY